MTYPGGPFFSYCPDCPRFWYFKWNDYVKAGKIVLVPKWFFECTVDDVKEHLTT